MTYQSINPYDRKSAEEYLKKLLNKDCAFSIVEIKPQRSKNQNSYLHLLLGYFGSIYGCSLDEAKVDFFKRACNKDIFERTHLNKNGREVKYLRSSKDLDTREMTIAINRFRDWAAAEAGIYLPSPNEEQFLMWCRKEVERNVEFL